MAVWYNCVCFFGQALAERGGRNFEFDDICIMTRRKSWLDVGHTFQLNRCSPRCLCSLFNRLEEQECGLCWCVLQGLVQSFTIEIAELICAWNSDISIVFLDWESKLAKRHQAHLPSDWDAKIICDMPKLSVPEILIYDWMVFIDWINKLAKKISEYKVSGWIVSVVYI